MNIITLILSYHAKNFLVHRKEIVMKRIEKFMLILSVITAIKMFALPIITTNMRQQLNSGNMQAIANAGSSVGWIGVATLVLTNLVCGIWLLLDSKQEKLSSWVWFLSGVVFGLNAVIVFYLFLLYIEIRLKWRQTDQSI